MTPPPDSLPHFLAIETATRTGSVAVFAGPQLLGCIEIDREKSHARLLTPMVRTLLDSLELAPSALSAIAVGRGPGSYTGLRVGVSTAKGLCMALDKPLLAFDSLAGLAGQVAELATALGARIVPLIDARRMEVYTATYDAQLAEVEPVRAEVVDETTFAAVLAAGPVIFVGDGAAKCQPLLETHPQAIVLPGIYASARGVGTILARRWAAQQVEDLVTFEPFYLKAFRATKPRNPLQR